MFIYYVCVKFLNLSFSDIPVSLPISSPPGSCSVVTEPPVPVLNRTHPQVDRLFLC